MYTTHPAIRRTLVSDRMQAFERNAAHVRLVSSLGQLRGARFRRRAAVVLTPAKEIGTLVGVSRSSIPTHEGACS